MNAKKMNAMKAICITACSLLLSAAACHRKPNDGRPNETLSPIVGSASATQAGAGLPVGKLFPPGPERPAPAVQLDPPDLSTAVGQGAMHVLVSNLGAPVGADLLGRIAQSVALKTWPEEVAVPIAVSKVADASGRSDEDEFAHIYFTPVSPLADRWYALVIDVLPDGASWASTVNYLQIGDGGRATRFRVGSGVVVSGVRVYTKAQGKQVVNVDFSERVAGGSSGVGMSYAAGGALPCDALPSVVAYGNSSTAQDATGMTVPTAVPDPGVTSIRLACSEPIDVQQEIRLDIRLGVTQGVSAMGTLQVAITPDRWNDLRDGGKRFKPTLP